MSTSGCPCNDETTPCPKVEPKSSTTDPKHKQRCPPLGLNPPIVPGSNPPEQPILPATVRQPMYPYSGICPPCTMARNLPDAFRCSVPPRYEANRQSIQKCRDLASCVPQSSDQLVIYNTFCPMTTKGKTSPSLRMTTITQFLLAGPPQPVLGSFPAIPPLPPIIIPQPIFWYEEIQDGSSPYDLRDVATRSFNTGWMDNMFFRIATPGIYRLDVNVTFIGVGSIISFIFDFIPAIFKTVIMYIQFDNILDLDDPIVVGEAPSVGFSTLLSVTDPIYFRFWIITMLPSVIKPSMKITKYNEAAGTSVEHLNVTRMPYMGNPSPNS